MKASEIMRKYNITRRTLYNWVKNGVIKTDKTPSGRYIYHDTNIIKKCNNNENM